MERVGIFFKLIPGKKEEYIKRHDEIEKSVTSALNKAKITNFSIWNEEDMLFSYYEVADAKYAKEVLDNNADYQKWRDDMENYIYVDSKNGQKEWFLKCVFFNK